jgi:TRAP-type mannitol/chloroaromatic compound transport system permease large subunit
MQMENFAPIMFAGLVIVMLIGFPVAFSLAARKWLLCHPNGLVPRRFHGHITLIDFFDFVQ